MKLNLFVVQNKYIIISSYTETQGMLIKEGCQLSLIVREEIL